MTEQLARLQNALADRYRLERELGADGMATVYLAENLRFLRTSQPRYRVKPPGHAGSRLAWKGVAQGEWFAGFEPGAAAGRRAVRKGDGTQRWHSILAAVPGEEARTS